MNTVEYIVETIGKLVNIPSPSGFAHKAIAFVKEEAERFGFTCDLNQKGGLIIHVPGKVEETIGLSAHVDTLGAMVRSINSDGTLRFTSVGGFTMQSIEGSYCTIHTRDGKEYTGTILANSPSVHTFDDARTLERKEANMHIRIDEIVKKDEDVKALGIETGDYVSFDPKFSYTESGFIKSRHLDDKASVGVLLGLLKDMSEENKTPEKNIEILISNYEEVGFGASYLPANITEFLAVDMGALGDDLNGTEYAVSICAKDSTGPYDYELTTRLVQIAKEKKLDYAIDIFPHYGSDVSAAYHGGNNIKGALIGQGIHASHGMERTHKTALKNTLELLKGYVL
ncbi:M42 family metallopeptidase [Anaerosporobacter faecicola]|uniref:M42 family metallopeptidase n=1 Tax=Anaerosporobacter faecicola TaxID=2718714 RepID=UPI0014393DB8|nr:M42 family metallopeptidase [Anaerosporobacter faecicola]